MSESYILDPLVDYLDTTTGQKVRALKWDGTPRQFEALKYYGIVEPPADGNFLVILPPAVLAFSADDFGRRFEFVGMGEVSHGA